MLLLLLACPSPTPKDNPPPESAPPEEQPFDCAPDYASLTAGVSAIEQGGSLPSLLIVHGDEACPIVLDEDHSTFVAAARYGQGRALHAGHEGMIVSAFDQGGDNAQLLLNAVRWAGQGEAPVIGVESGLGDLAQWLGEQGFQVDTVGTSGLDAVDVFITTAYTERDDAEVAALQAWVHGGGGLLQGGHAWWWAQSNDDVAEQFPGNKVLNAMGITVTELTVDAGSDAVTAEPPSVLYHAGRALDAIEAHLSGAAPLSDADQRAAAQTVRLAVTALPFSFSGYFDRVRALLAAVDPVVPTEDDPIVPDDQPIEALLVAIQTRFALGLAPEEVSAVPAEFPGPVDAAAPRVALSATILASYAGRDGDYGYSNAAEPVWRGTGAYAAPGEIVTVTVPQAWVNSGMSVQIGAHTDSLSALDAWERFPELTRSFPIEAAQFTIASGFGGPIYVRVPGGLDLGEGEITLAGAVAYPRYVRGQTDPAALLAALQAPGAPLVEFESDRFVLTVPRADLAATPDPEALTAFWDTVLDAFADLAAISHDRVRPERFVVDVQISAGWMHSGYPIMGYDYAAALTDAAALSADGDWGAFHELGHNHQYGPMNLPGTTECTVNLWSVYGFEEVLGLSRDVAHDALSPAARADTIDDYIDGGRDFAADWSVWTCLETYLQLQERFGWDFVRNLNATYLAMPEGERPGTDQERIDTWVVQSSLEAGYDLTGFYDAWGFPTSAGARAATDGLPDWTDHPMAGR